MKRNLEKPDASVPRGDSDGSENANTSTLKEKPPDDKFKNKPVTLDTGTYWLTRVVFLRALAFIYGTAFLVAYHQNKELLGDQGLLPISVYLKEVQQKLGSRLDCFLAAPSLLWYLNSFDDIDFWLDVLSISGLVISSVIFLTGAANAVAMAVLWIFYHSIVNVGQRWYGFGWETQLLETGFLCIWLVPFFSWKRLPSGLPSSWAVCWGYRWLLVRIMLGAGLIKVRGDRCWLDLTCMNYHYETQPVPNPVAYYLHQAPTSWHKFETLSNHFVELVVPWFAFLTRRFRITCGILQIVFQMALIISGNLSFLNWLTILPSIWFLDDRFLSRFFSSVTLRSVRTLQLQYKNTGSRGSQGGRVRRVINLVLFLTISYLSIPVVLNLISSRQAMNTSFEPFRIVNTYGAFGSVTKKRTEVIMQGSYASNPHSPSAEWMEYEFKCKPGNITRKPCLISPYHYRLDWLMWFAAFQNYQYNPWLIHLSAKLLVNDDVADSLIEFNPFHGKDPPRWIRGEHYRYKYSPIGSKEAASGQWWTRTRIGSYFPPIDIYAVKPIMRKFSWKLINKNLNQNQKDE